MPDFSLLRMMDSSAQTAEEAHQKTLKHLNYITRPTATRKSLIFCDKVEPEKMVEDFGFFRKCNGDTGRPLKHAVVSFGYDTEPLEWQLYLEVTKEIAGYYGKNYQIVAAVHNNIPNRPHAHILIDCFNISTGKKFSEGPNELEKFKDHVDGILKEFEIPLLRRRRKDMQIEAVPSVTTDAEYDYNWYPCGVYPPVAMLPQLPAQYNCGNYHQPQPYTPTYPVIQIVNPTINNYFFVTNPESPNTEFADEPPLKRFYEKIAEPPTKYMTCSCCGRPLSGKEETYCIKHCINPPLCYKCQRSK